MGSEIKSFLSHPCFVKELDEEKIPEYLSYEYIPYESTIFKNVYKLPGAHCFTYKDGKLTVERYYRIQYKIEEDKPLEYWEEQIQKEFEESVAMHQIADVEVGCFLSSGVDSSYVVREISKGTEKVKTFSVATPRRSTASCPTPRNSPRPLGWRTSPTRSAPMSFSTRCPRSSTCWTSPCPTPRRFPCTSWPRTPGSM